MRLILLGLVAFLVAATAPKPQFTFRDWKVGDIYKADDARFLQCVDIGVGKACVFQSNRIGGIDARQIGAAFGRNGLFALEAKFPSDNSDTVEIALRDRYGAPCESRTESATTLGGGKFTRLIRVWCFAEGRATFKSFAKNHSEGSFEFATYDSARQQAAQDF